MVNAHNQRNTRRTRALAAPAVSTASWPRREYRRRRHVVQQAAARRRLALAAAERRYRSAEACEAASASPAAVPGALGSARPAAAQPTPCGSAQLGPASQAWVAEFGEFLLRSEVEANLIQTFKSVVKLATGQGIRPLRAADAVPFAAGARISLYADTRKLVERAERYTQVRLPRSQPSCRSAPGS